MFKRILVGVLLFATVAGADQVFVRNKPFKGEVTSVSGQVFVDLRSLTEALEVNLTPSDAGGFVVGREPATPEQLSQAGAGQVIVAGQPVEAQAGATGNLLVPLKTAAELLGAKVTANKQLGSIDVSLAASKAKVGLGAGVRTINTPGAAVDVTAHLSPGIMNVVWFTAPWCGPCQQMAPVLDTVGKKNAVLKVEIGRWGTPVTKQYNISSIPYFHVYDASGKLVSEGQAARQMVNRMGK